jgi:glycosyltransferase involved in cell wall biosynthesis
MVAMSRSSLSIGMTVFNDAHLLDDCLRLLARNTPPGTNVVAFDNGSTDGSDAILARHHIRTIRRAHTSQPDALNILISELRSRYVLLLHSDVFLLGGRWFEDCAALIDSGHALVSPQDHGMGDYLRTGGVGKPESSFLFFDAEKLNRLRRVTPAHLVKRLVRRRCGPLRAFPFYSSHLTHQIPDLLQSAGMTWFPMEVIPSERLAEPWYRPGPITGAINWNDEWGYLDYGFGNFYLLNGAATHYHNWYSRNLRADLPPDAKNGEHVPMTYISGYTDRFLADLRADSVRIPRRQ